MAKDYNTTLNLPKTEFPMRAGLPKREPDMLKAWQEQDLKNVFDSIEAIRAQKKKKEFREHPMA